jgi:hypothetical protein
MGATAYLFNDYVKGLAAGAISLTSEDSNYPRTNLQNEQVALCARTTAKVAVKLQFTLDSAKALQIFAVLNHNFSGGTFDINSYEEPDFATGKITVETKAIRLLDVYHREASAPAARQYWEFDFSSATSADSYFEIGRAMLYDDAVQITEAENFSVGRGYGYRNIVNETPYGVRWVHKLAGPRERFLLQWGERAASGAVHTELRALYAATNGGAHPILYVPDLAATGCYCVYIEDPELLYRELWAAAHVGGFSLGLVEAVRGKA